MVRFPAPEFYCFYIGSEKWESRELRLSEAFLAEPKKNSIELIVNIINLNYTIGEEILQRSPSLLGYSKLVEYIRQEQSNGQELKAAIDTAVKACIREGLIEDFLKLHSREVSGMLFRELTMEEFADIRAREAYGDGVAEGIEQGEKLGLARAQRENARKMKDKHIDLATIIDITGLSRAEIEAL